MNFRSPTPFKPPQAHWVREKISKEICLFQAYGVKSRTGPRPSRGANSNEPCAAPVVKWGHGMFFEIIEIADFFSASRIGSFFLDSSLTSFANIPPKTVDAWWLILFSWARSQERTPPRPNSTKKNRSQSSAKAFTEISIDTKSCKVLIALRFAPHIQCQGQSLDPVLSKPRGELVWELA